MMLTRRNIMPLRKLMMIGETVGAAVKLVEDTATGNPLKFTTDLAKPLRSLLIPFTPVQSGTGDPSPQNVRPIVPWNGLTVFGGGKNLLNPDGIVHNSYNIGGFVNTLKPNTKYTISINGTTNEAYRLYMTTESAPLSGITPVSKGYIFAGQKETFTTPSEMTGILVLAGNSAGAGNVAIGDILPMIEAGETATAYEPYKPISETDIVFPSPIYGGTPDIISGRMLVEWYGISAKWGQGINKSFIGEYERRWFDMPSGLIAQSSQYYNNHKSEVGCNIAKYVWDWNRAETHFYCSMENSTNHFYVFLPQGTSDETDIQCMCKLKEPFEIQLTPTQITAMLGNNTIWSDADGSMTAVYLKKG